MKEKYLNNIKVHSFSTRNKTLKPQKISSYKHINTFSKKYENLTPLEEKVNIITLQNLIMKAKTANNSKNNSFNGKYLFNEYTPKEFKKDYRAKLFYLRDKNVKKKILTPNIFAYANKDNINRNNQSSYKNTNKTPEEKAKLLENEKISKIIQKINKKSEDFKKFLERKKSLIKQKDENEESYKERKNLKLKMFKIIGKKGEVCQNFIKKNENFNVRFINYLNSKDYIKSKKLFSENFHFSKNDLNKAHDPYKQYLTTYSISKNSVNINDIFNALNNKDKLIIEKEPNYFFRNNVILEEFKDLEKKPLFTTIREEEEIKKMIKNKISKTEIEKYKEKNDIINQRLKEYNKKNKKIIKENENENQFDDIPPLINKDTMKNIKDEFETRLKHRKKNLKELIDDELKYCEKNIAQNNLNNFEDNKNFNKTFNKKIKFCTKINVLENNNKRLGKEEIFQVKRNINKIEEKGEKYINNLKNQIIDIYNSNKSIQDDKNESN